MICRTPVSFSSRSSTICFSNGFGYLDAQRVLSDGEVACVNDTHGVPVELNISMLTSRAYTEDEAKALVAAMQQADHTDGFPPLC